MKRNVYFILALLLAGILQVRAQQMAVVTDTRTTEYAQWPYESAKITFSNGQMLFHYGSDVLGVYSIKDVKRIYFYGNTGGVDAMPDGNAIVYSPLTESLHIDTKSGASVAVYQMNGVRVLSQVQTIASPAISVAHLPSGQYIVVAGSETLKFVKQ